MAIRWDDMGAADDPAYLCKLESEKERLDALYRAYHADVLRLCVGNVGAVHADDAAQETMLKAAAKLSQYRHEEPFRPWLKAIARNVCRDFRRSEARIIRLRDRQAERGGAVTATTSAPDADCPEEAFRQQWNTQLVIEALLQLPELSRKMLYWQLYEGLSYDEIAVRANRSRDAVRSILNRAKASVREHIEVLGGSAAEWRAPAFIGAGMGVIRRMRARSRAWLVRNSGTLGNDGASTGSIALSRAAEVVATAAVAVGVLFFPGPSGSAHDPLATAAAVESAAVQPASSRSTEDGSAVGRAGDAAGASTPAPVEQGSPASGDAPVVIAVPEGVLPAPQREGDGYERQGDRANNDFRFTVDLPTGPFEVYNNGGFDCTADVVYQTTCDALDRVPDA